MLGFKTIKKTDLSRQVVYDYLADRLSEWSRVGSVSYIYKYYQIDQFKLRVAYANEQLLAFFHPAIAFVEVPQSDHFDGLTIYVAERPDLDFYELMNRMEDSYFEKEGVAYQVGAINNDQVRKRNFRGYNSIQYIDNQKSIGFYLMHELAQIPKWEKSFSFRDLLNWHFTLTPYQLLHGAGIAYAGQGAFLTAKGGSGKSTTTIQCLLQGMQTVGDDFTFVNVEEQKMHCIYNIAKLRPDMFQRLSDAEKAKEGIQYYEHNQKYHLDLGSIFPDALVSEVPIKCLIIPQISGELIPKFELATPHQALNALLPNTLLLFNGNRTQLIRKVQLLLQDMPCYFMHLSSDLSANPKALKRFLEE